MKFLQKSKLTHLKPSKQTLHHSKSTSPNYHSSPTHYTTINNVAKANATHPPSAVSSRRRRVFSFPGQVTSITRSQPLASFGTRLFSPLHDISPRPRARAMNDLTRARAHMTFPWRAQLRAARLFTVLYVIARQLPAPGAYASPSIMFACRFCAALIPRASAQAGLLINDRAPAITFARSRFYCARESIEFAE